MKIDAEKLKCLRVDLSKDFPDGEPFEVTEYVIGATKANWICGTEKYPEIQLVALYQQIDFREFEDGWDEKPFPVTVECSTIVHPKYFSQDYMVNFVDESIFDDEHGGLYPLYWALGDAYSYGGGIPFSPEFVTSNHTCDVEFELVKSSHSGRMYRHFKDWEDANRYTKEVYIPNTDGIMMMSGFMLDGYVNRIGTTGWDHIMNMTEGTDWLQPAFDRARKLGECDED